MKGSPIIEIASHTDETNNSSPLKEYDILHISKDENSLGLTSFTRSGHGVNSRYQDQKEKQKLIEFISGQLRKNRVTTRLTTCRLSHESSLSHQYEAAHVVESKSHAMMNEFFFSVERVEGSFVAPTKVEKDEYAMLHDKNDDIELELTFGFE